MRRLAAGSMTLIGSGAVAQPSGAGTSGILTNSIGPSAWERLLAVILLASQSSERTGTCRTDRRLAESCRKARTLQDRFGEGAHTVQYSTNG